MQKHDPIIKTFRSIAEIDRIIHEPARFMILSILSLVKETDFLFLRRQTGLTQGNLSSHLSRLEAAGYIEIRKEFVEKIPRTVLRMTEQGDEAFSAYQQVMKGALKLLGEQ